VGKKWKANERRAEIMRILESRRQETMANFAFHFDVSIRTICYDIDSLMALYPIKTVQGNNGCVKPEDGYAMYQSFLSEEQQETLLEIFPMLSEAQSKVIAGLLRAHGSRHNMERIEMQVFNCFQKAGESARG